MATAPNDEGPQNGGEYKRPDAAKAIEIYDKQIAPKLTQINTLKGDLSDPWGDLKEHARISKKDFNYVQSLFDEEDDAKRDHRLLCLTELLKARGLDVPDDLVTRAEGTSGGSVVPIGKRGRKPLATLHAGNEQEPFAMGVPSDGTETDLADAGEDTGAFAPAAEDEAGAPAEGESDFTEATDEELAQQEGRPKSHFEKMYEAAHGEPPEVAAGEDSELPQAAE